MAQEKACNRCELEFCDESQDKHEHCHKLLGARHIINHHAKQGAFYVENFDTCEESFLLLHQNIRSLNKNINGLKELLITLKQKSIVPAVVGVSETWIQSNSEAVLKRYQIEGYNFINKGRLKGKRGGAGIYISDKYEYKEREDINIPESESVFIELSILNSEKMIVGVVYSTEKNRNLKRFCEGMDEVLECMNKEKKKVIIMGDLNIDLFKIKSQDAYHSAIHSNGFKQMGSFATREEKESSTLIDHIITNISDLHRQPTAGVIYTDITDHYTIYTDLPIAVNKRKNLLSSDGPVRVLSFKNYNDEIAICDLEERTDWSQVYEATDVATALSLFIKFLKYGQDRVVPIKEIKTKKEFEQPWMTEEIRRAQKHRYMLYKKHKASPKNEKLRNNYKTYRNRLCGIMRRAEAEYYSTLIEGADGNQSKTWHIINDIIGRRKKGVSLPDELELDNGERLHKQIEIGTAINAFFTGIGKQLAEAVPAASKTPGSYIKELPDLGSFFINPVTDNDVLKVLQKIKTRKACGPDGLHPRYIQSVAPVIVKPLTYIINKSIETGSVPHEMKVARVVPIHKSGSRAKATNYRPISLLSVLAKVIESLVYDQLNGYLSKRKILTDRQYGFRKEKSTKSALIRFINTVQKDLDNKKKAVAVYIDLKKAFDTVNHKILIQKLELYGIRGHALEWFKSYLNDRKQYVACGQVKSNMAAVEFGVPQGSNLGPLLFLIYVNDLPRCLNNGHATLFADDTTVYNTANNIGEIQNKTNEDLKNLVEWCRANKLTLNTSKTYGCIFGENPTQEIGIKIGDTDVNMSQSVKYLGVHVDSKLSWKAHIAHVANKINQTLGALYRVRHSLNLKAMKTVYYSLIHSHLIYCQEVWGTAYKTALVPLVIAQKKAIRLITNAQYRASTAPLFKELSIRPLMVEIRYRRALLAYEMVKNPNMHQIELNLEGHPHSYSTRFSEKRLPVPRKQSSRYGVKGIEYLLTKAFNELPIEIRNGNPAKRQAYKKRLLPFFQN